MQFEYKSKLFDIEGVSKNDHIYKKITRTGTFYEINLLEYIYQIKPFICSKECMNVFIDVGANIGNHSVFFSSFLADHLIAIEPNPSVLPQLRRNLLENVNDYTIFECAVGEKERRGTIDVPENICDNIGAAKVNVGSGEGDIEILTVDSIFSSWQDKIDNSASVSLIKIDVEGMEQQVLKGAENTILKHKPHIFAEAATKDEFEKIYTYLWPLGYRKLPGHWAATPVYHFAFKPTLSFIVLAGYWEFRRVVRKTKSRLSRRLTKR
jgi:FkbM family methyltransferase